MKEGSEKKVHKLKKALYKLKQAPRAWYSCIKAYFDREGLLKYPHEHTLFTKFSDNGLMLIMYLYVDDLRYTRNNCDWYDWFGANAIFYQNIWLYFYFTKKVCSWVFGQI